MSSSYHAAWVQARLESTSVYVVGHHTLKREVSFRTQGGRGLGMRLWNGVHSVAHTYLLLAGAEVGANGHHSLGTRLCPS